MRQAVLHVSCHCWPWRHCLHLRGSGYICNDAVNFLRIAIEYALWLNLSYLVGSPHPSESKQTLEGDFMRESARGAKRQRLDDHSLRTQADHNAYDCTTFKVMTNFSWGTILQIIETQSWSHRLHCAISWLRRLSPSECNGVICGSTWTVDLAG